MFCDTRLAMERKMVRETEKPINDSEIEKCDKRGLSGSGLVVARNQDSYCTDISLRLETISLEKT